MEAETVVVPADLVLAIDAKLAEQGMELGEWRSVRGVFFLLGVIGGVLIGAHYSLMLIR